MSKRFRILVGIDFSEAARVALDAALTELGGRGESELHLVTVLDRNGELPDPNGAPSKRSPMITVEDAAQLLGQLLTARTAGDPPAQTHAFLHVRTGAPDYELLHVAEEIEPDLIVVGSHGRRGLARFWMGSVAERVVRGATCPVLVVRRKIELEAAEPPCLACALRRRTSAGRDWWCDNHHHHREAAHRYAYSSAFDFHHDSAHPLP